MMPGFYISRAHGSFEIGRRRAAVREEHEPLLHAFIEERALRIETNSCAQARYNGHSNADLFDYI